MPRPRTFDEDRAVDAAMKVFWSFGYEGTSTQDLCDATGLGRSSIYNTFTSKRDLFDRALRHYMETRNAAQVALIQRADLPIRERVRQLLWDAVEPAATDPLGCFVVNTLVELAPHEPEIAELLERDHTFRVEALTTAFNAAQTAGEIDAGHDPAGLAEYVFVVLSGLRVSARAGATRAGQETVVRAALRTF
ncbi:TetR/AcrR family transcriptional regulator [Kribbella sp. NPDC050124]|uniref:TetR/AcrR family transcriptional regulator n=1 Tax=Kribbella sp. NPDC050124 TaxID=3364114 RepID=UPI00379D5701